MLLQFDTKAIEYVVLHELCHIKEKNHSKRFWDLLSFYMPDFKKQEEIFLGREISQHRDYSENTAQAIDQEVRVIIERAAETSENLLKNNIDKLHKLAKALLENETLDGKDIDEVINNSDGKIKNKKKNSKVKKSATKKKMTKKEKDES